jgi:hypothetical protein
MSMKFILIKIKFDIDTDNNELLIIIWEHNKKKNWQCIATQSTSLFWGVVSKYTHI